MKITVNIIATNKYTAFVQQLVTSINRYFLHGHQLHINIFTDDAKLLIESERASIQKHQIPPYKFPEATTLRYKIMTSVQYFTDYIFYLDADMLINDFVGDEILGDIVAVRHPGYYIEPRSGAWEMRPESTAYIPLEQRIKYYAGGFQGGKTSFYLPAMIKMREAIEEDAEMGIEAVWNDESHWNKFLIDRDRIHELNPTYCMPELWSKRVYSKIHEMPARILALEKSHDIRQ